MQQPRFRSVQDFATDLEGELRGGLETQPTSTTNAFEEVTTGLNDERGTWIHPRLVSSAAPLLLRV